MNLKPNANELWIGIGGTFDKFTQVGTEFVDNSIANALANKIFNSMILITIDYLENNQIKYVQEDNGTGIEDVEKALTIGNISHREHVLNEHGFGMKHAFASANPKNDDWVIYTRTKTDMKKKIYKKIQAPYSYDMDCQIISEEECPWPGDLNGSGTIIQFTCCYEFFRTVQDGIRGNAGTKKCLEYYCEDLGYVYSYILKEGKTDIKVKSNNITTDNKETLFFKNIVPVEPKIINFYKTATKFPEHIDLGGGQVKIDCIFLEMDESDHYKYYLRNQSTSGAEIRINGRVILNNIFKDIWNLEVHPQYNHFLAIINIVSNNREKLPKTMTTKSGIRIGDEKLLALYEFIKKIFPDPPRLSANAVSEKDLLNELKVLKDEHLPNNIKHVQREFPVFKSIGCNVKVDLYVFDGSEVLIYEAAKTEATIENLYQIRMYWDGCIIDGITPNKGVLLASIFSDGVKKMIKQLNQMKDISGDTYNIITKTWNEEGINHP